MEPSITLKDGLAIYRLGVCGPLLLFPYPHASTLRPMAEDRLARMLAGLTAHFLIKIRRPNLFQP